jgi:hypothetical protein
MTSKLSGTDGLLQQYDYQTPTTGFSYTFAAGTQVLVMNPAGTLATGTITMPSAPSDGMTITIESTQQITAITVAANTGQTLVGAPSQIIPNQPISFIYRLGNTTWYPFNGGAGRASTLVSGTTVASTSGTSIDFTGIPSWVKRITVMFSGVSTSGTSKPRIQLGISSGVETTGYAGTNSAIASASANSANSTAGFDFNTQQTGAAILHGSAVFSLLSSSTNTWVCNAALMDSAATYSSLTGGSKALAGTLDRVRITTVNGTDTFDAGSINILYE